MAEGGVPDAAVGAGGAGATLEEGRPKLKLGLFGCVPNAEPLPNNDVGGLRGAGAAAAAAGAEANEGLALLKLNGALG